VSRVFAADGNWYLHRVIHTQVFESKDEQLSQASRFLAMVSKDAAMVKAKRVAVAFDGSKIFRYKLYSDYKGNRTKDKDGSADVYAHLQFIKDYLGSAGFHVIQKSIYEADDILCSLASIESDIVIGTKDKDANQYLRSGMFLYDSSAKPEPVKTRAEDVITKFGLSPDQWLDYQTLIGDNIDHVPNLMNKDKVKAGLLAHDSIRMWAKADPKFRKWLTQNVDAVRLNRKLVKLVSDIDLGPVPDVKWSSDPDFTKAYHEFRNVANSKTKGLFK